MSIDQPEVQQTGQPNIKKSKRNALRGSSDNLGGIYEQDLTRDRLNNKTSNSDMNKVTRDIIKSA